MSESVDVRSGKVTSDVDCSIESIKEIVDQHNITTILNLLDTILQLMRYDEDDITSCLVASFNKAIPDIAGLPSSILVTSAYLMHANKVISYSYVVSFDDKFWASAFTSTDGYSRIFIGTPRETAVMLSNENGYQFDDTNGFSWFFLLIWNKNGKKCSKHYFIENKSSEELIQCTIMKIRGSVNSSSVRTNINDTFKRKRSRTPSPTRKVIRHEDTKDTGTINHASFKVNEEMQVMTNTNDTFKRKKKQDSISNQKGDTT